MAVAWRDCLPSLWGRFRLWHLSGKHVRRDMPELTLRLQRLWIAAVGLFTAGIEVSFLGMAALTGELTNRRLSRSDRKPAPAQWPRKGR